MKPANVSEEVSDLRLRELQAVFEGVRILGRSLIGRFEVLAFSQKVVGLAVAQHAAAGARLHPRLSCMALGR
jgi:hypothetical protein